LRQQLGAILCVSAKLGVNNKPFGAFLISHLALVLEAISS
jgi:hypothetical protein